APHAPIVEGDGQRRRHGLLPLGGRHGAGVPTVAAPARDRVVTMDLQAFQELMAATYGERDAARGLSASVAWLVEEVGELAQAIRKGDRAAQLHEVGD